MGIYINRITRLPKLGYTREEGCYEKSVYGLSDVNGRDVDENTYTKLENKTRT